MGNGPVILYEAGARGLLTVSACSCRLARVGVRPGMPLAEAESLLPSPPVLRGRGAGGEGAELGKSASPNSSFPGSAWERTARQAPPAVAEDSDGANSGGRASKEVRSQAEPGNEILQHDRAADRATLRKLALSCDRYTPIVALEDANAPECLLLDITGSSHLFGGERRLAEKVVADLRALGYAVRVAVADGIGAAWAVAHSLEGRYGIVPKGKNRDVVPELGIDVLRLTPDVIALLHQFDLRHIRQLMALPRGQVAIRFGHETLTRLDQTLGAIPEILAPERRVPPVRAVWTFEDPISHPHVIEKVLERLIGNILETLTPRQTGVQRLVCTLTTADKSRTEFTIGLLHPTLSADRLLGLVRLRLERTRLPDAVTAVNVRVQAAPLDVRQRHWFDSEGEARRATAFRDFVERVSSRLGEDAVLQPRLLPEDQPELAWDYVPWLRFVGVPALAGTPAKPAARPAKAGTPTSEEALASPIDLLPPLAVRVETEHERPRQFAWRQRLYEVARVWGPQRIETGWWRGHDIRRDYYRVEAVGGERFWLYRDRNREAWFMQGVFA